MAGTAFQGAGAEAETGPRNSSQTGTAALGKETLERRKAASLHSGRLSARAQGHSCPQGLTVNKRPPGLLGSPEVSQEH